MSTSNLPLEIGTLFSDGQRDAREIIIAFMPVFCDYLGADRIFVTPRNPITRVCTTFRWRRSESIPWPAIPIGKRVRDWIIEDKWEVEDPLFRAALHIQPSIYVENLEEASSAGILNIDFEKAYMFHTAFIHGHAHWPPVGTVLERDEKREFYGSVQPAIFSGERIWEQEVRDVVELCLVKIAPVMRRFVEENAPDLVEFKD